MPSSILPPGHSKSSWWSRSKTGKEPSVKPMRSFSSLSDDNEKSSTSSMFPPSTKSKDTSGLSLKTLGSAISFKSKKVASLTIQNVPSDVPIQAPPPPSPPADFGADQTSVAPSILYSNRIPTIKSIRTDRSTELDNDARSARTASEPRTPSDYRTSYQPSVLTFSELDPFASSGVIVQQGHDPNRLSAYSDSSMLEPTHKRGEILFYNRISYASSSSKSQGHSSDSHSMAIASPRSSRFSRPEGSRQNTAGTRDSSLAPPVSPLASPRRQSPSGSSGSTVRTGEGPSRLSEPVPGNLTFQRASSSFLQRPRGMTIGASGSSDWRPSTANPALPSAVPARLRKASDAPPASPKGPSSAAPSSSASPIASSRSRSSTVNSAESFESPNMSPSSTAHPLVVVRKASSTRVTLPPLSRAPSQDLPPTPFPESDFGASDSLDDLSLFPDAPSSSSSSMSFAPSMDLDMATVTGDMINQLMLHGYEDPSESKSKGKGRASRRKANSTSPSDTLRDFELVHPGPSSSTSKLPSMPASSEGGSADLTGGMYSASMRSLQRVSSQQSLLGNRFSGASQSSAASGSVGPEDGFFGRSTASGTKSPRKQRSFHHSRLPLPPIPALRHATSDVASPASPSSPPLEQRKSSGSGHQPTRKRLFSGSSARRSTSSHGPSSNAMSGDEDNRSIYSVDDLRAAGQKIVMSFGSFANPLSLLTSNACVAPGSYLPDANMTSTTSPDPQTPQTPTGPSPSNRASQTEYIPQHIMSPADMLKLEQQLAQEAVDREQRDEDELPDEVVDPNVSTSKADHRLSVVSAATSAFGNDNSFRQRRDKTPVSSPPSKPSALPTPASRMRSAAGESSRLPFRSHSALMSAPRKPSLSLRPSTATSGLPPQATSIAASSDSPQQAPWSLPPPPRSRPVRDPPPSKSESGKRLSTVPLQPLSPPPTRLRARISSLQGPAITQRPSPASISRSPSAFGNKVMHRKSLMKKPSFLDIEDEADATSESLMDVNLDALDSPTMDSSFLDMDRGKDSFDTVRSSDSLLFV